MTDEATVAYCRAFAVGFSIPVLLIDGWLDGAGNRDDGSVVAAVSLIYRAQADLAALPRGAAIVATLNSAYDTISTSALRELRTLFCLPSPEKINEAIEAVEQRRYYRSLCGYFSSVVSGVVLLAKRRVDPDLREFLSLFGILRQVADDIADVDEDLPRGLVTLPVMYAMRQSDLREEIQDTWRRTLLPQRLRERVAESGGFEAAFEEGMRVYEEAIALAAMLQRRHRFIAALLPFYELKHLLLRRLRHNAWVDSLSTY